MIELMENLDDFAKSDLDKLERLAENFRWINLNYENLKQKYDKQYVAIKDGKILDKDSMLEKLLKRLSISNYDESIAIEYMNN